jgi:RNA polymerase sigma-70 factor (ECF subfamily)
LTFERVAEDSVDAIYAYFLVRLRNEDDANDLTQETFAQAVRSWRTFDPSRPPKPWLYGIARRVYARHLDTCSGDRRLRDELERMPLIELVDPDRDRLPPEFAVLPHSDQEVLILVVLFGMSVKDAANHLGIKRSACSMRLKRALGHLHHLIGEDPNA